MCRTIYVCAVSFFSPRTQRTRARRHSQVSCISVMHGVHGLKSEYKQCSLSYMLFNFLKSAISITFDTVQITLCEYITAYSIDLSDKTKNTSQSLIHEALIYQVLHTTRKQEIPRKRAPFHNMNQCPLTEKHRLNRLEKNQPI